MSEENIEGTILESKIFPICEDCRHLVVDCKGIFRKTYLFGCGAQGFQSTSKVYGSESCKNIFINQLDIQICKPSEFTIIGGLKENDI